MRIFSGLLAESEDCVQLHFNVKLPSFGFASRPLRELSVQQSSALLVEPKKGSHLLTSIKQKSTQKGAFLFTRKGHPQFR